MAKRILIADDEPDVLDVVSFRLSGKGYEIILAVNGQEAVDKCIQQKPDLVLMDYRMPLLDGLGACKMIKENENLKQIPVIIMSASQAAVTDQSLLFSRADGRIIKPFEPSELFQLVEKFLK